MRETLLIINRWDDEFSRYDRYVDHHEHQVAYIASPAGSRSLRRDLARAIEVVEDLTDREAVVSAARRIARQLGPVARVLALSEFDLEVGARVREALEVPGASPAMVRRYKDKVLMKQAVEAAGLRVPRYVPLEERSSAAALVAELGLPLILKPRVGASSRGVVRIDAVDQLAAALRAVDRLDHECERFIEGPIFHVDGLAQGGALQFVTASRYINTCLAFNQCVPLGSVMIDDAALEEDLLRFTRAVLEALALRSGAFHLELIQDRRGDLHFLEIGARVGGGEIPFLALALYELDLMNAWVDIELGRDTAYLRSIARDRLGGFLMIPEPRDVPCRLVRASSLAGKVEHLIGESLPAVGHVFDGHGGYEHISGRFLFCGPSSRSIEAAIHSAIRQFSMETEPVLLAEAS